MGENHALAPWPQWTPDGWHRFVASGDHDLPASLLSEHSEHIAFRSPFVQSPIPGRPATMLVLTTVVRPIKALAAVARKWGTGSARN
jgi:hypothetical protein